MRILWAFEIEPSPGTELPLNPTSYHGFMPGNAVDGMPVTLRVRSEEWKRLIEVDWGESGKGDGGAC